MNISLQKVDEVNGKLTVKIVKADYEEKVQQELKKIKKQAKMPGFRPGMVPMSLIQKMYGMEVKAEELQKLISESINKYIETEKLDLLAAPLTAEDEEKIDIERQDEFEMKFDLALAPAFEMELSDKDKIPYYNIEVTEEMINQQVDGYRRRTGKFEEAEVYTDGDLLKGKITEVTKSGNAKKGGMQVEDVSVMPKYFTDDEQKKLFDGAKKGPVIFNLSKAYAGKDAEIAAILKIDKEEVAKHKGDFKYEITSISHLVLAEMNQDLFDLTFGKDAVKTEKDFLARIKADMESVYVQDSDYKFILDVKDYCLKKVGTLQFPEATMKREMLLSAKDDKQKESIEKDFKEILVEREWSLICSKLMKQLNVKVEDENIKEAAKVVAKSQFAQYGMNNVPDEYIERYADDMLKDEKQLQNLVSRAIDIELTKAIKATVKLQNKKTTVEKFNAMFDKI